MKTYRLHNCAKRHRTYNAMAKCIWRRAHWVTGEGEYASRSCILDSPSIPGYRRGTSVMLFVSLDEAESAKKEIDRTGCGGYCQRRHEIIRLELPS